MQSRLSARRPSPALIISMIALIVAMGGTGYAAVKLPAGSVGTKQLKNNAVTGAKVKNRSLTGADIKLSSLETVPAAANASHAVSADSATNASNAANAAQAANATHATAADTAANGFKAYARINANGTVDPEVSVNITNTNLTKKAISAYCFHGLSFGFHGAIATVQYTGGGGC
jgi:gamma-glutamyl-gamma-aminobutyrate hydrolase PuuD